MYAGRHTSADAGLIVFPRGTRISDKPLWVQQGDRVKKEIGTRSKAAQPLPRLATGIDGFVTLRLYIVGGAPNSVEAIANLEAICKEHLKAGYRLEVVDVLEHPRRAIAEGVLVTPSLTKLSPRPTANVVGNLSDRNKVVRALGLKAR